MNTRYTKVALYAFKHLIKLTEQINELVEKKALSSISDVSPAIRQYEKITEFTYQKKVILSLYVNVNSALKKLSGKELEYLDYKYFRTSKSVKSYSINPASRNYFRVQIRLLKKVSQILERGGYTDERFKKECLQIEFFREMLKRVTEKEKAVTKRQIKSFSGENKIVKLYKTAISA